ncbi:TRAP transporter small permease [Fodinicurvata sp. EGI_FJ10296]|jgi:TRAP-type C4-dicarboxylate transport system permease small subunit|uniref:TRAP transporter small permease n=1 Tax=Fodinicurvata sp. EGI_FJ10296 TaxID=3231908 RepID=UPI003452FE0B
MTIQRTIDRLERVEEALVAILLTVMLATIILQVLARYVFNLPLAWTEELARYLFIWLIFLGSSQAMRWGNHIAIGMVADRLPDILARISALIVHLLIAAFLVVLIFMGWRIAMTVAPVMSVAMKMPLMIVYLPLPIAGAVMLVRTLCTIVRIIRHGAPEVGVKTL